MSILLNTRLVIKKRFPRVYQTIRDGIFPSVETYIRAKKRHRFTAPTTAQVHYSGQSFFITLDPSNGFVDEQIFVSGIYEPDILTVINDYLPPGGTLVDIGANIGQHSLFAANLLKSTGGQVVSFEPIPKLAKQLKASIDLNRFDNIIVHELACSDQTTTAEINIVPHNIGASSLHHSGKSLQSLSIPTAPADEYLLLLERIDVIKIDTEGHEIAVLKGLHKTLQKFHPALIIEFSPTLSTLANTLYGEEFFAILSPLGYRFYDLEMGTQEICDTKTWLSTFSKLQTNILCTFTKPTQIQNIVSVT